VDPARRIPDRIPGSVLPPVDVIVGGVHLHAERVGEELECPALIVEGIEGNAHEVVAPGGIPIAQVGTDRLGVRVFGVEREVEVLTVLDQVDGRLHPGCDVLAGPGFVVEINACGLLPGRLVHDAIDRDFCRGPGQIGNACPGWHNNARREHEQAQLRASWHHQENPKIKLCRLDTRTHAFVQINSM